MDRYIVESDHCLSYKGESMSDVICIYPQDATTVFLRPLCNFICSTFGATEIGFDTSGDDDPHEAIYAGIRDAQTVFFLGHGKSDCLYASITDNDVLIDKSNVSLLEGKHLFLLACNSEQFIKKYGLSDAIGFGFLPTSKDDVDRTKNYHKVDISGTAKQDVDCFNASLVNCLIKSLSIETMNDPSLFAERLKFNVSIEIVDCLINTKSPNYRIVADELFYLYKDLRIK